MKSALHTVGQVASMTGVTIRTLHHYDSIGLLQPSERSAGGYRLYAHADLERLQEILLFRELGLALDQISEVLADPAYDRARTLRRHRELLQDRIIHLQAMVRMVDDTLKALENGVVMTAEEMFEVFGDFDPADYAAEAEENWGDTAMYAESHHRTASYSTDDWAAMKTESEELAEAFVAAMQTGSQPDSTEAMDVAERHRQNIDRWFYRCSHELHDNLGSMYLADPRFTEYWDKQAEGLAEFVSAAITANALRH